MSVVRVTGGGAGVAVAGATGDTVATGVGSTVEVAVNGGDVGVATGGEDGGPGAPEVVTIGFAVVCGAAIAPEVPVGSALGATATIADVVADGVGGSLPQPATTSRAAQPRAARCTSGLAFTW